MVGAVEQVMNKERNQTEKRTGDDDLEDKDR